MCCSLQVRQGIRPEGAVSHSARIWLLRVYQVIGLNAVMRTRVRIISRFHLYNIRDTDDALALDPAGYFSEGSEVTKLHTILWSLIVGSLTIP